MDSNHRLSFPECIDSNIPATIKRLLNCYEKFLSRDLSHSSVSTKRPESISVHISTTPSLASINRIRATVA